MVFDGGREEEGEQNINEREGLLLDGKDATQWSRWLSSCCAVRTLVVGSKRGSVNAGKQGRLCTP